MAKRSVDKPAQMAAMKFVRGAAFPDLHGTFANLPAGANFFLAFPLHGP